MTFTHNHKNDTTLERDGKAICFSFTNNDFDYDTDTFYFYMTQDELFEKLGDYFDECKYQDIFDELTLPQQDALWNALLWLNENNVEV